MMMMMARCLLHSASIFVSATKSLYLWLSGCQRHISLMSGNSLSSHNAESLPMSMPLLKYINSARLLDRSEGQKAALRPDPDSYLPATHHVQFASAIRPSPVWYLPGAHHAQSASLVRPVPCTSHRCAQLCVTLRYQFIYEVFTAQK